MPFFNPKILVRHWLRVSSARTLGLVMGLKTASGVLVLGGHMLTHEGWDWIERNLDLIEELTGLERQGIEVVPMIKNYVAKKLVERRQVERRGCHSEPRIQERRNGIDRRFFSERG